MRGLLMYKQNSSPQPQAGFHIPTQTEWDNVKTLMTTANLTTGNLYSEVLKIPFCGCRDNSTSVVNTTSFLLWTATPTSGNTSAKHFRGYSNSVAFSNAQRAQALNVRCFSNTPIVPDNTRTKMFELHGVGIYWNSVLGVISITDGNTTITIKDKNEGATTVFNYGDTVTAANTGNTYQWGNMYGFPSTKDTTTTITTSNTTVNTTGYGSGTWYNSSTYITGSNDWSSPSNDNLWNGAPAPTSI